MIGKPYQAGACLALSLLIVQWPGAGTATDVLLLDVLLLDVLLLALQIGLYTSLQLDCWWWSSASVWLIVRWQGVRGWQHLQHFSNNSLSLP